MTINKAAKADTATLLFQSGWSGRAEMGLAGHDGFSIKTSVDGTSWHTALLCSGDGRVSMPNRPLAVAGLPSGTTKPANGSAAGFPCSSSPRVDLRSGKPWEPAGVNSSFRQRAFIWQHCRSPWSPPPATG